MLSNILLALTWLLALVSAAPTPLGAAQDPASEKRELAKRILYPEFPSGLAIRTKLWEQTCIDCGLDRDSGFLRMNVATCIVNFLERNINIKPVDSGYKNREDMLPPPPKGIFVKDWEKIWTNCGDRDHLGMVTVETTVCVVNAVERRLGVW